MTRLDIELFFYDMFEEHNIMSLKEGADLIEEVMDVASLTLDDYLDDNNIERE